MARSALRPGGSLVSSRHRPALLRIGGLIDNNRPAAALPGVWPGHHRQRERRTQPGPPTQNSLVNNKKGVVADPIPHALGFAMPFKTLGLHPALVQATRDLRYAEPTP